MSPREEKVDFGAKRSRVWRMFTINISLVILLFLMGVFVGFVFRTNQLIRNQFVTTARAHFKNIVLTRRWNANYGGVFVKKTTGVISNPYLENPDITTTDGVSYTMKNPALMTREISVYAQNAGDFKYHITSLNPLNLGNGPDSFETEALTLFEQGKKERFIIFSADGHSTYRYMAPLFVEKSCLACHEKQGYKIGDVRGGISVSFDVTEIEKEMRKNKTFVFALSAIMSLGLLYVVFLMITRLANRLSNAYRTIEMMSITDELTQVYNRRHFQTRMDEEVERARRYGASLSFLLLDIDHFKKVNDSYSHQSGDAVLKKVAALIRENTRKTDVAARYGGEEFAIILPETDCDNAVLVAEKIRAIIEKDPFRILDGKTIHITASLGVSSYDPDKDAHDRRSYRLIQRADEALYTAKNSGRNRIVRAGSE